TSGGTLMMFNNGIYKTRPFNKPAPDSEAVSGALEYRINSTARTASLMWSSDAKGPDSVNTFAMGDANQLPKTGNVMVVYGSGVRLDNGLPWSRVREYTHTTPPKVLYDVVFAGTGERPAVSWIAFGGERIPKLQ
ncbi:MAG: hypothetical protein EXQ52_08215, partial [Bryobacterales bacterium]|nr:hypothetical protein [Bryobacterales bacterium]